MLDDQGEISEISGRVSARDQGSGLSDQGSGDQGSGLSDQGSSDKGSSDQGFSDKGSGEKGSGFWREGIRVLARRVLVSGDLWREIWFRLLLLLLLLLQKAPRGDRNQ